VSFGRASDELERDAVSLPDSGAGLRQINLLMKKSDNEKNQDHCRRRKLKGSGCGQSIPDRDQLIPPSDFVRLQPVRQFVTIFTETFEHSTGARRKA